MIPWTGIETRPGGGYKPCCLYDKDINDPSGKPYNTKDHTISEVMNSKEMQDLRQQFKDGQRPLGCSSCWKEEDSGKISKRQHMWIKAPEVGQSHVNKDIIAPRFVDLKLGNICNLKCRICSPHSSSQWVNDMIKMDPANKKKWKEYNEKGLWPRENNKFMKDLEKHIETVRYFEITGGEPLMIQQQFDVLQKCVEAGTSKNIDIHYNTNGTQYPEQAIKEIWPHFKRVEIAFSIDDLEKRFEYQRHPAKWDDVEENIQKFKRTKMDNMSMQICTTINIFNINSLKELAEKVKEWAPDYWYINILHNPREFDVQQLPDDVKKVIADNILSGSIYKKEIQTAVDYMMKEPSEKFDHWLIELKKKIKQIDLIRQENFSEVFPLLNKVLKIYD